MLDDNGMETSLGFGRGMFCCERKMPAVTQVYVVRREAYER